MDLPELRGGLQGLCARQGAAEGEGRAGRRFCRLWQGGTRRLRSPVVSRLPKETVAGGDDTFQTGSLPSAVSSFTTSLAITRALSGGTSSDGSDSGCEANRSARRLTVAPRSAHSASYAPSSRYGEMLRSAPPPAFSSSDL